MATAATPRFSTDLSDQIAQLNSVTAAHIAFLADVREFYREKAALDREHATRLQALVKKSQAQRNKRAKELIVGAEPTKSWTDGSGDGHDHTLDAAWTRILSEAEEESSDWYNIAESLNNQVCETLKTAERKKDETRKKHHAFSTKLVQDRDKVYSDRDKAKVKYDDACGTLESYRQRQDGAKDERHHERAAKSYDAAMTDMHNAKNSYLLAIAVSNAHTDRFYTIDLPSLHDDFQTLWTQLSLKLHSILTKASLLERLHFDSLQRHNLNITQAINSINPAVDQQIFVNYNFRQFEVPAKVGFEPCSIWHDDNKVITNLEPKVVLQNKLVRSRRKLGELDEVVNAKRREITGLQNLREAYSKNEALGDADEVLENLFEALRQVVVLEATATTAQTEVDTIVEALGDDQGGQQPHEFKPAAFTIPATCSVCTQNIWGMGKPGLSCKNCGVNVHNKCELKMPADCRLGVRPPTSSSGSLSRRVAPSSLASPASSSSSGLQRASSNASSFHRPAPSEDIPPSPVSSVANMAAVMHMRGGGQQKGLMTYAYEATTPFEVTVAENESVSLVEPDDGSGWVKVSTAAGKTGLVPASYIEIVEEQARAPPARPPPRGSAKKKKRVRAVYAWMAQSPDEVTLAEGEEAELTEVGLTYGEGWAEVITAGGQQGILPSNYIEQI